MRAPRCLFQPNLLSQDIVSAPSPCARLPACPRKNRTAHDDFLSLVLPCAHNLLALSSPKSRFVLDVVSTSRSVVKFYERAFARLLVRRFVLRSLRCRWYLRLMPKKKDRREANRAKLRALVAARDPQLAPLPPTTVRDHCNGKTPSTVLALALYVRKGLPLEGWLTKEELALLDKVCPWPVPDVVYDALEPFGGGT